MVPLKESKKYKFNKIYFIFGIIAVIVTAWSLFHDITNIPNHHIVIPPGSAAAKFVDSSSISTFVGNYSTFFYFTMQANIIFAIITTVRAFYRGKYFGYNTQVYAATYMVITFLVFWFALSYIVPWSDILLDFEQIFLHLIFPIFSVILIFFYIDNTNEETIKISKQKKVLQSLYYPIFYYVFLWIFYISISGKAAVYPFANFYEPFLYNVNIFVIIIINILVLLTFIFFFIGIYFALEYIHNKLLKSQK